MIWLIDKLCPKLFDWRIMNKNYVRLHILLHLAAFVSLFNLPEYWLLTLLLSHTLIIGLGISVGFHRLLSHRSFSTSKTMTRILAFFGTLALQGGVISWVSLHRSHHRFTDDRGDPHSSKKGLLWSHYTWMFHKGPNGFRYKNTEKLSKDLYSDPVMVFLQNNIFAISIVLFSLTWLFFGWRQALFIFSVRVVFGWHIVFFVNSLAHDVKLAKESLPSARNIHWISYLCFGEGYHKNHHKWPAKPKFSSKKNQFDAGFLLISLLEKLKLANFNRGV